MLTKTLPNHTPSRVHSIQHNTTNPTQPPNFSYREERKRLILLRRHPHIRINRRTKRCKTRTPRRRRLRPSLRPQNPPGQTPRRNAIREIVLRPQPLDAALGARVEGADDAEVLGGGPGARAHVFEAVAELLAPGEVGDFAALGGEGGVVGHLCSSDLSRRMWL